MMDNHTSSAPSLHPGRTLQPWEEGSTTSSSVTACRRCRKHKVRCARELPFCKRCRDASAVCEYPAPPDRKLLAAQRLQDVRSRLRRESDTSDSTGKQKHTTESHSRGSGPGSSIDNQHAISTMGSAESDAGHPRPTELAPQAYRASTPQLQAALRRTTLPSPEVAAFLFEIYFSRLYNANLLFHKETFLSEYTANKIPDFVALSIFALASIFFASSSGQYRQRGDEEDEDGVDLGISMLCGSDSSNQGFEWATAASQRVLMQADVPRLETIQACQNLALYWFSRGQTDRTNIHTHIAYRTCRLLNFHTQYETSEDAEASAVSYELRRRCFWSCWVTNCISQENAYFKLKPWEDLNGLPLPSDEESFNAGTPFSSECFDENGGIKTISSTVKPSPSIMGEFVKLYDLWWEVQNFAKKDKGAKPDESSCKIETLMQLDRRLGLIFENFHPDFSFQNATSFLSPKLDPYRLFTLHSLYRLCVCSLHTSTVPLFSETLPTPLISKKLVRLSAQECVKHAAVMLDMAIVFLTIRPDISRLPSITGYAMFVACAVHFKSLLAQKKLHSEGTSRFKGALSILERLKKYWVTNQGLWNVLKSLFGSKGIDLEAISRSDSRPQPVIDERHTDLESIVSHKGTPNADERTDIYTYVPSEEAKGASARLQSKSSSSPGQTSVQNTPPERNTAGPQPPDERKLVHMVAHESESHQRITSPQTFTVSHQHIPNKPQEHFTQGPSYPQYNQHFTNSLLNAHHEFPARPNGSVQLATVAEEYQIQGHRAGMGQLSLEPRPGLGQGVDGIGSGFGYLPTDTDVDGMDFWWDQSYESASKANLNQINDRNQGGGSGDMYTFSTLAFS